MEFKVCEKSPFGMAIKMSMGSDGTKINAYFIFDEEGYALDPQQNFHHFLCVDRL